MKAFYGYLQGGATKDAALRMAQVALMKDPKTAHPLKVQDDTSSS